jgi:hypothetical protein
MHPANTIYLFENFKKAHELKSINMWYLIADIFTKEDKFHIYYLYKPNSTAR